VEISPSAAAITNLASGRLQTEVATKVLDKVLDTQTQIATFSTALDAFEVDTGAYPLGSGGLQYLVAAPGDISGWRGPYLKSDIPADPWGHPYIYEYPGKTNPTGYDLRSSGPDGQANTADDLSNGTVSGR